MTTIAKTSALAVGFLVAVAIGIMIGPSVRNWERTARTEFAQYGAKDSAKSAESKSVTSPSAKAARRAPAVTVSTPELHARLRPLLNKGANMTIAAEGFRNAEQFATVAHAARNTEVPFLLLKHRVLNEGKSVASAIQASKPDANAAVEANLARAQARSDIAALAG